MTTLSYSLLPIFIAWISFSGNSDTPPAAPKVPWSESSRLNSAYFQAIPDPSSFSQSHSACGVEMKYTCKNGFFKPSISAYFDCTQSWIKDKEDPNLVALEQLKFDIAHFHAIKLQKKVSNMDGLCNMKKAEVEAIVLDMNKECHQMQEQAEQMSEFGKEPEVLELWALKLEIEVETMVAVDRNRSFSSK